MQMQMNTFHSSARSASIRAQLCVQCYQGGGGWGGVQEGKLKIGTERFEKDGSASIVRLLQKRVLQQSTDRQRMRILNI